MSDDVGVSARSCISGIINVDSCISGDRAYLVAIGVVILCGDEKYDIQLSLSM